MPAIWVSFTSCIGWYLTCAKRGVPITFDDAKALWQIHKKPLTALVLNGIQYLTKAKKFPASDANADTRTLKDAP